MRSKPILLSLLLLAVSWYIITSWLIPLASANTPICGICHAVSRQYKSHRQSLHAKVGCLTCHNQPGISGKLLLPFEIAGNLAKSFKGSQKTRQVYVSVDNCLACHDKILTDTSVSDSIRVSHRAIIKSKKNCQNCHANTGHRSYAVGAEFAKPTMDKCLTCHNNQSDIKKGCKFCHLKKPRKKPTDTDTVGRLAHGLDWAKNHGANSLIDCRFCHKASYCRKCHNVNIPHDKNWGNLHGKVAIALTDSCRQCHKAKFCDSCHIGIVLPHPKPYRHTEEANSKPGPNRCMSCHQSQNCKDCHIIHAQHLQFIEGANKGRE